MKLRNVVSISIFIIIAANIFINLHLENWNKKNRIIEYDVRGYYFYLPAIFIYNDIGREKSDYLREDGTPLFWHVETTPLNRNLVKYTSGLSILYSPFFLLAHSISFIIDNPKYPPDGFNPIYKIFLQLSALFYLFIGLWYLAKTLEYLKFKDHIISITLLSIGLGTNLLAYSSQSSTMPHVYGFFLFSIFIYFTIKWHIRPSIKYTFILGIVFGMITLIRPTNGLIAIIFLAYNVNKLSDLFEKLKLLLKEYPLILIAFLAFLIPWFPQFIYWKYITGNFIYYSYGEEGFNFLKPEIMNGLFSFRKGWLVYTPIMAFSLLGLFFFQDKSVNLRNAIFVFIPLNMYIIFSWWCWWYGGSFGQRTMIDSYALLAIPFANFLVYVFNKKTIIRRLFSIILIFLFFLNIFQTYQFENLSLHHDSMSKKLFFKQFLKMDKVEKFDKYLEWAIYKKYPKKIAAIEQPDTMYNLISCFNEKYLCTELNGRVSANRDTSLHWESFYLNYLEKDLVLFYSYNLVPLSTSSNTYLSEIDQIKDTFRIEFDEESRISLFETKSNMPLSLDTINYSIQLRKKNKINLTEKFKLKSFPVIRKK